MVDFSNKYCLNVIDQQVINLSGSIIDNRTFRVVPMSAPPYIQR